MLKITKYHILGGFQSFRGFLPPLAKPSRISKEYKGFVEDRGIQKIIEFHEIPKTSTESRGFHDILWNSMKTNGIPEGFHSNAQNSITIHNYPTGSHEML